MYKVSHDAPNYAFRMKQSNHIKDEKLGDKTSLPN